MLALPDSVNVRAVGSVNWREMVVSGSERGGYCDSRWRVMTTVRRSACEAAPRVPSIWVGMSITWRTVCPGISTSAKPTAEALWKSSWSLVVPSMVTRSVWKLRRGRSTSARPRRARRSSVEVLRVLPVEGEVTEEIQRVAVSALRLDQRDVIGRDGVGELRLPPLPAGSGTKVPVIQAVSKLLSMAL